MGEKKINYESLWKIKDVMNYLGMGRTKVQRLTSMEVIPSHMIDGQRRYVPDEIRKFVKKQPS